ncbi:hypothetical protein QO058_25270 [Bosea vestrisii]|uniref:hypothetical protein n=1 Tax=Bosea vestrisii TaxID=151416 RepID=UPI0024DFA65B|nr:hypothetical protein [Bosea vestrisii]WID96016.1 hypothetical protein QO058_25270 [Bosea vestrisii]
MTVVAHGRTDVLADTLVGITNGSTTVWGNPYYLYLSNLQAGDIIQVFADIEAENTATYNVEFATQVLLTSSWVPNNVNSIAASHILLPINGYNVDQAEHYYSETRAASYQLPVALTDAVMQFRLRTRSSAATGGQNALFKPGQGFLSYTVLR